MTPITYIVMSILLLRNVLASGAITASKQPLEVNYNLRLEISDPDYLFIHVNIAYMVRSLLAASEAPTASKQPMRSFLKVIFEISDLNYICCHISLASKCFWEMIKSNKRRDIRRPNIVHTP